MSIPISQFTTPPRSLFSSPATLFLFLNVFLKQYLFLAVLHLQGSAGAFSSCGVRASPCRGFPCCRSQALGRSGFSSCGSGSWLPHGMWDLPGPGLEPVSLVLQDGFLTTGPTGKPLKGVFLRKGAS